MRVGTTNSFKVNSETIIKNWNKLYITLSIDVVSCKS